MDRAKRMEVLNILDECRARKLTYSTAFNKIEEIFIADEQSEVSVEAKVGMPSEILSCEQVRNNTIEECARHLEELAEKANDVLVEERHILQEDTVELFRNDIDHARRLANNLRGLASKP